MSARIHRYCVGNQVTYRQPETGWRFPAVVVAQRTLENDKPIYVIVLDWNGYVQWAEEGQLEPRGYRTLHE